MNKKLIYGLILVIVIIISFLVAMVVSTSKIVEAPKGEEAKIDFHGPTGAPYVKGPTGPPPSY